MKFAIAIPNCEGFYFPVPFAKPSDLIEMAQKVEKLGYYAVWCNDHINAPEAIKSRYQRVPNFYETVVTLACLVSSTKHIRLGAGSIMLPLREPVLLAKQMATLDAFSGGRTMLGVGVGRDREEFTSVKPREKNSHRGTMFEEFLEALTLLFNQDNVTFKGKYYEFQNISICPKPVQKPLPIYVSGKPAETSGRVVRWGHGYLMSRTDERSVSDRVKAVQDLLKKGERDTSEVDMGTTRGLSIATTHEKAVQLFWSGLLGRASRGLAWDRILAQNIVGSPSEIAEQIDGLRKDGITHLVFQQFAPDSIEGVKEQVQMFAEEAIPLFRAGQ